LYGVTLPRWPAQYIGFALTLIAIGYLISQRNKNFPSGFRFALAVTLIAVISFMVSTVRGDDVQKVGSWRLDTIINMMMIIFGAAASGVTWFLAPAKEKQ
jgi:prolipoprotein diacylglyceryltransferase